MLDIKFIRENADLVKKNNQNRGVDIDVDRLLELDVMRRERILQIDQLRALRNKKSKTKPLDEEILKMKEVGRDIDLAEKELAEVEAEYKILLEKTPNLTHPESPIGGEEDFKVLEESGKIPKFDFKPKDHEQLMLALDQIDFERGAKVAGAKFYFLKNDLVRLNRALVNYGIETATKRGYMLMETPDLAKNQILEGIGFSPRGPETQVYSIENTDLSLIGTAEITVGGYHSNEVLDLSKGPVKYVALSHCFRTEGGAYGRVSKGLYRVHQFTKLEMFVYCKPQESEKMHKELLAIEREICEGLQIPFRVIDIASADLGGPAYRKFDIEAWMTMVGENGGYGEITSTSNCTDYQARRLNIKYRKDDGSAEFVHTLNGTAIALTRLPIAIFENYQQKDGSIKVPKVLQRSLGFKEIRNDRR
ncbi:MAG: serine--tRNA ligase [Candidatus Doudnabacteria bacterium]|nr:serine--tRNA ligase [Candidatus Doudnabacteria bacterium]